MTPMKWLLVMAMLAVASCSSNGGNEGDCSARVRFEGSLYRPHDAMPDQVALGPSVGRGEVVGCGGLDAPAVARVEVRRIEGVDPEIAIGTRGDWRGLYIRDDLASQQSSWPEPIRP
jgi:hypothetical protein